MKHERIGIVGNGLINFAARIRRSQLCPAIVVGLCCSAGLFLTADSTLNQLGRIDQYVYLGYVHDYPGLLARFGRTYYSTRIAYIYPERAFAALFGVDWGYFAFRFLAVASAVAAVFAIGMRFYGFAPALLAAVWLSFTPWLPRSLLWTYVDGFAVAYLLVGAAFLLVPTSKRLIYHITAGAAFALAVNSNLFVLAICGLLGPGWIFFYRREGVIWLTRAILALALGFFAMYFVLALLLYVQFPSYGFFFELTTIRSAISLLGGQGEAWFRPLSSIIWEKHSFALLIPVTFALAALSLVSRRSMIARNDSKDFEVLAASYLASIICLSLILHFGFSDAWLSTQWYTIYFAPGCVLTLLVLSGEAERCGGRTLGVAAVLGGAGLILLSWLERPLVPNLTILSSWSFWLAVAALIVVAALALRRAAIAAVVLVFGAVLLSFCFYEDDFYDHFRANDQIETDDSIFHRSRAEWDVYHGAIFLQEFVNANVRPDQSLGFWYSGQCKPAVADNGFCDLDDLRANWLNWFNSIQSVYLWNYTRLFPSDGVGMPQINEQFRSSVAGLHFIILLGKSDAEADRGLAALQAENFQFQEVNRIHFHGQEWGYTAVIIALKPTVRTLGPLLFNLPTRRLEPANGASVSSLRNGLRLNTSGERWSYSLTGHLRFKQKFIYGPVVLRVRLQVEAGQVGVAVSGLDDGVGFIHEVEADSAPEVQEVYLDIPDASAADSLIVRNRAPLGPSRAVIYSVDVLRPAGAFADIRPPVRTLGRLLFQVPIAHLEPANGARISTLPDGLRLNTGAQQWSYSLIGHVWPDRGSVQGAVVVRVRLKIEEGSIGVAVGSISNFIQEASMDVTQDVEEVDLDIPDVNAADLLIIRNQSPDGSSRGVIYSVDVFRPK